MVMLISAAGNVAAQAAEVWAGRNSGYRVDWTDHDITATRISDGKRVFSMRAFAAAQLDTSMRQETSAAGSLTRERTVSVVSLFGPMLALRDDTFDDFRPSAHPSERIRFWTIDLGAPAREGFDPSDQFGAAIGAEDRGRIRSLDQIVPAQAIADALSRDKVVRSDLTDPPRELDALLTSWRDQAGNAQAMALAGQGPSGAAPCHAIPEDVLTSFAIIGRNADQVAVRLGLPGEGACHANLTQIGLTLPLLGSMIRLTNDDAKVVTPPARLPPLRITAARQEH